MGNELGVLDHRASSPLAVASYPHSPVQLLLRFLRSVGSLRFVYIP